VEPFRADGSRRICADAAPARTPPWHLDEVYLKIAGRMVYLGAPSTRRRDPRMSCPSPSETSTRAELMRKLLKKIMASFQTRRSDDLRSYGAAARDLGIESRHERGRWKNNRAENRISQRPQGAREQRFKSPGSAQKFLSTHAPVYNIFNVQRQPHHRLERTEASELRR